MFWELCFQGTWSSHKGLCCGIKVFTKLREYREEGNQSIEVMVDYPNRNHRTNGGTKKEKKSE